MKQLLSQELTQHVPVSHVQADPSLLLAQQTNLLALESFYTEGCPRQKPEGTEKTGQKEM